MAKPTTPRQEPSPTVLRHFVFAPGGPVRRNGTLYYFASLIVFLIAAAALQLIAGLALRFLSIDNRALQSVLLTLRKGPEGLPWQELLLLFAVSFGTYWIALAFAVESVHRRKMLSVLTDRARFAWRRLLSGFVLYFVLLAGPFLLYVAVGHSGLEPHFDSHSFWQLVLLAGSVLLLQSATEEAVFRGYLTQFVASFTDSRLLIVGVPAVLFTAAHIGSPELAADPGLIGFYFGFGVFMALTAMRERGLELVIGAHFANNFVNSVLLRTPDSIFHTPAIFILPEHVNGEPTVLALSGALAPVLFWIITAYWRRPGDQPTKA